MRRPLSLLVCLPAVLLLWCGCTDGTCTDRQSAMPLVRFVTSGTTTATTLASVTVRGIGATGADSLLADRKSLSDIYLPLRATTNETRFEITRDATVTDTLTLRYRALPYFASAECGAMYVFDLDEAEVTRHGIDSVETVLQRVDNVAQVALRLHIPTSR